jgi:hypothetical protein
MNDSEIYSCAQILIELHGKNALKESRTMLNTSIAANDNQTVSLWCKIEDAILDLNAIAVGQTTIN